MKSFHNDPKVKDKYLKRLKEHAKADEIIQGTGWEDGKGCAVGCTLENYDHSQYPIELGIPEWLAHLEDSIFEGLTNGDAKAFPVQFLEAMPVGVSEEDLYKLLCDLDYQRLERLLKEQKKLYKTDEWGVQAAIKECMRLNSEHVDGEDKQWSAARSAAESAAWSARSAESAAWSAAWSSAWSVARSAAWIIERDNLLKALKQLTMKTPNKISKLIK